MTYQSLLSRKIDAKIESRQQPDKLDHPCGIPEQILCFSIQRNMICDESNNKNLLLIQSKSYLEMNPTRTYQNITVKNCEKFQDELEEICTCT